MRLRTLSLHFAALLLVACGADRDSSRTCADCVDTDVRSEDTAGDTPTVGDVAVDSNEPDGTSDATTSDAAPSDTLDASDTGTDTAERPIVEAWPPPDCRPNTAPFPTRAPAEGVATLPPLRVEASEVVDGFGSPVDLRGVNFGTWLMVEAWMAGLGELDEGELIDALAQRAAELGVGELFEDARRSNALDFLVTARGHRVLVHEWKQRMFEDASDADLGAVTTLWDWFDEQPWVFEEESLWAYLGRRFGDERADELREVYQQNYITELDFERAAELGFTAIRLPIWYGNLERESAEGVSFRQQGWDRLDDALNWARRHGLYVIIDLHGAPGGQSPEWHQGLANGGFLFDNDACLERSANLWRAIAAFVGNDPHVAAYDLINEPSGSPDGDAWARVHDALYDAVREVDDMHIIMAEDGYRSRTHVSGPAELGWDNAMFSIHVYPESPSPERYERDMADAFESWAEVWPERFDCPVLLGEFNAEMNTADGTDAMNRVLGLANRRGVHWSIWTWKFWEDGNVWGVYHRADGGQRIDLRDATFDEIRAEFEGLHSANFVLNEPYGAALRERSADPHAPLALAGAN